jgi:hypothetical protein
MDSRAGAIERIGVLKERGLSVVSINCHLRVVKRVLEVERAGYQVFQAEGRTENIEYWLRLQQIVYGPL